jgi:hypothetical protein
MRNVRRLSPVSVNVCQPFRRAERFSIGAINAQHRLHAGGIRCVELAGVTGGLAQPLAKLTADLNASYAPAMARHDAMLDEVAAELNAEDYRSPFRDP